MRSIRATCALAMTIFVECGGLVAKEVDGGAADDHDTPGSAAAAPRDAGRPDTGVGRPDAGTDAGKTPGDAGTDASGSIVTYGGGSVLYGTLNIIAFALGPTDAYLLDLSPGSPMGTSTVVKVPKSGGPAVVVSARQPSDYLSDIAIDATRVYWTEYSAITNKASLQAVSLDGGDVTMLVEGDGFTSIAVDATGLYWTTDSAVMKAGLDGSNARAIATGQSFPTAVSVRGALLCWTAGYASFPDQVFCSGLEGENPTKVWDDGGWVQGSASETNDVVLIEEMGTKSGGVSPMFLHVATLPAPFANAGAGAPGGGRATRVAFDDTALFFGWPTGVAKVARGAASIDVTPPNIGTNIYGRDVAVDDTNIYWIQVNTGGGFYNSLCTARK
jgi:hypothetical protein